MLLLADLMVLGRWWMWVKGARAAPRTDGGGRVAESRTPNAHGGDGENPALSAAADADI